MSKYKKVAALTIPQLHIHLPLATLLPSDRIPGKTHFPWAAGLRTGAPFTWLMRGNKVCQAECPRSQNAHSPPCWPLRVTQTPGDPLRATQEVWDLKLDFSRLTVD